MTGIDELPPDWEVWTQEADGAVILVYRPDVFDTTDFPAECQPMIYVRPRPPGRRLRRAGESTPGWYLAVHLEPEVRIEWVESEHDTQGDALEAAIEVASQFSDGTIDYRSAYQVPREDYLDALDELTGRDA